VTFSDTCLYPYQLMAYFVTIVIIIIIIIIIVIIEKTKCISISGAQRTQSTIIVHKFTHRYENKWYCAVATFVGSSVRPSCVRR